MGTANQADNLALMTKLIGTVEEQLTQQGDRSEWFAHSADDIVALSKRLVGKPLAEIPQVFLDSANTVLNKNTYAIITRLQRTTTALEDAKNTEHRLILQARGTVWL